MGFIGFFDFWHTSGTYRARREGEWVTQATVAVGPHSLIEVDMKIEIEVDEKVVAVLKKAVSTGRIPELQVGPRVMNTPSEGPQVAYGFRAVDFSKEHWPPESFL